MNIPQILGLFVRGIIPKIVKGIQQNLVGGLALNRRESISFWCIHINGLVTEF